MSACGLQTLVVTSGLLSYCCFSMSPTMSPTILTSDPWNQQDIFLHTTAAHWLFSLLGTILCLQTPQMVVWENPSRSVDWEIVRPARLPPKTIFIVFKSVKLLFFPILIASKSFSKSSSPLLHAQVAVMWLADDLLVFTSSWTWYLIKWPVANHTSNILMSYYCLMPVFRCIKKIMPVPTLIHGVKITDHNNSSLPSLAVTVKHSAFKRLWILSFELKVSLVSGTLIVRNYVLTEAFFGLKP